MALHARTTAQRIIRAALICVALLHCAALDGALALTLGRLVDPIRRGQRGDIMPAGITPERREMMEPFHHEQHLRLRFWRFAVARVEAVAADISSTIGPLSDHGLGMVLVLVVVRNMVLVLAVVIVAAYRRATMVFALVAVNALCFAIDKRGKQMGDTNFKSHLRGLHLNLRDPQACQLVTATLCHRDADHLTDNMLSLLVYGLVVETQVGPWGLLLAYFFCGVGDSIAFLSATTCTCASRPPVFSLGASGASIGLLTFAVASLVHVHNSRHPLLSFLRALGVVCYVAHDIKVSSLSGYTELQAWAPAEFPPWYKDYKCKDHFDNAEFGHLGGAMAGLLLAGLLPPWRLQLESA